MIRPLLSLFILLAAIPAAAQHSDSRDKAVRYRTAVTPYDIRYEARRGLTGESSHRIDIVPAAAEGTAEYGCEVTLPFIWIDGVVYLHAENAPAPYTLWVNGRQTATVADPLTPAEIELTDLLHEGVNTLRMVLRNDLLSRRIDPERKREVVPFAESYIYYQNRRSICDFEAALIPDTMGRQFGMLDLRIIVRNAYNYEEPVSVGFDIYSPDGDLMDYNNREIMVNGRSTDTVRFSPLIYHTYDHCWNADGNDAPLYMLTIFTRRDGTDREYMPVSLGFGRTEFRDGRVMRFGKEIKLNRTVYNAAADTATTRRELTALRTAGHNTVCPDYPQPEWFYALCDQLGLFVIDRAAISAPENRENRSVGGTPTNDPALADEYVERVKRMYYRSRNHTCVVAYSLGSPSGNGYNMYKAYQWLKSVEKHRPVIYEDAAGEWNSDM